MGRADHDPSRIARALVPWLLVAPACANDYADLALMPPGSVGGSAGSAGEGGSLADATTGIGGAMPRTDPGGAGGGPGGSGATGGGGASTGGAGTGGEPAMAGGGPGGEGGAPPLASCAEQYPGHMMCVETEASCEIYVFLGGVESCAQHCALFGGECLDVWDDVANTCSHLAQLSCTGMNGDALCTCSRGCGGGPACASGQTCQGGVCL